MKKAMTELERRAGLRKLQISVRKLLISTLRLYAKMSRLAALEEKYSTRQVREWADKGRVPEWAKRGERPPNAKRIPKAKQKNERKR